jgi:thiol-disulfide isomerase/thioredoxin
VVKEDVAEVLRRRFFTPESIKDQAAFKQHVIAALKGIQGVDEQMAKQGAAAEERFLKSFPFHPDLTEVFYGKWTQLDRFQRTRGVLRTFALALREAEKWDTSPLVGPAVFLNAPGDVTLSEAARELVTVADTEEHEGKKTAWTGIIDSELTQARRIQNDAVGLKMREIEQAVMATLLHSQPIGQAARTRDLVLLIGASRPDKIELEKGLVRWARASYWLDDTNLPEKDDQIPGTWRLGNRPNLNQMQAAAAAQISDDVVKARLLDEIGKAKSLTSGASALGVRVHTLPTKPKDIEDDGLFHYAVLPPSAASDSGKPSAEAKRYLDETSGPEKPRVFRNAVLLLAASRDGLEVAQARVREYLAWEKVKDDLTPKNEEEKKQKASVDVARMQTLAINIDKARAIGPQTLVGQKAPDFTLKALDGTEVTLSKQSGNVVVLDFWLVGCLPCMAAFPHLQALANDSELAKKGLRKGTAFFVFLPVGGSPARYRRASAGSRRVAGERRRVFAALPAERVAAVFGGAAVRGRRWC